MSDYLFQKGNKYGGRKPKGSKHQRTIILDALKAQSSNEQEFAEMLLDRAREGCRTSITILANRMWKQSKPTLDTFVIPESESKEGSANNIIQAMLAGDVSSDQAVSAITALRGATELTEIVEILNRLKALES